MDVIFPSILFDYQAQIRDDKQVLFLLRSLRDYGVAFVKDCPPDETLRLTGRIAWPRKTMYSEGLWKTEVRKLESTSDGADSTADTAYTSLPIFPHNDTCYLEDPCGLQIFHSIRADPEGGESQLVDTYKVCEALLVEEPDTFVYFSNTRSKTVTW
eukprot:GEMP01069891.1.p1 GENE.GEMP01069891.1~~GEMP01069891.1.p1  ORF type:complete len:156 (+),score=20.59 GEMP01069891.1:339-806(+)